MVCHAKKKMSRQHGQTDKQTETQKRRGRRNICLHFILLSPCQFVLNEFLADSLKENLWIGRIISEEQYSLFFGCRE